MNETVNRFLGLDPVAGSEAQDALIKHGENSLDLVIARFGSLHRTPALIDRLGKLFGHFGNTSLDRLLAVLHSGNWQKMVDSTYCFSNLSAEPAAAELAKIIPGNSDIDIQRCSIDALGYLGAKSWAFLLLDLFPYDPGVIKNSRHNYLWEKVSYNVFTALLRMAVKEDHSIGVHSYGLPDIERFYNTAGDEEFKHMIGVNGYEVSTIFSDFQASAADVVIQKWLRNKNPGLQKLAVSALFWMRLNRVVPVLRNYVDLHRDDDEIKRDVAETLAQIQSKSAADAIHYIFSITNEHSPHYKSICLRLASCLDRLEDKAFVGKIYPSLLNMGGEIAAHTYYNLGLSGVDEHIWQDAINSEDYIIRGAIAPLYAHLKGPSGIPRLLQMEREGSSDFEQVLILASLINAGCVERKMDLRNRLSILGKSTNYRMLRYTWKREIIVALKAVEEPVALSIWEHLFGIDSQIAQDELVRFEDHKTERNDHLQQEMTRDEGISDKKPVRLFISYAHKDEKWKDKLKSNLASLRNQQFLIDWDDRKIDAGTWDPQIEQAMDTADIFLLLVTHNFLSSDYITSREITKAYSQFRAGKAKIFPIICDSCYWQLQPITKSEKEFNPVENKEMFVWLGKFQAFPKDGKPIKKWRNQQDAFLDVIQQLKKYL